MSTESEPMAEDEDEIPQLSEHARAALHEFYLEQAARASEELHSNSRGSASRLLDEDWVW